MPALVQVVDIVFTPKLKYEVRLCLCGVRINFDRTDYVESILVKCNLKMLCI